MVKVKVEEKEKVDPKIEEPEVQLAQIAAQRQNDPLSNANLAYIHANDYLLDIHNNEQQLDWVKLAKRLISGFGRNLKQHLNDPIYPDIWAIKKKDLTREMFANAFTFPIFNEGIQHGFFGGRPPIEQQSTGGKLPLTILLKYKTKRYLDTNYTLEQYVADQTTFIKAAKDGILLPRRLNETKNYLLGGGQGGGQAVFIARTKINNVQHYVFVMRNQLGQRRLWPLPQAKCLLTWCVG